MTIYTILYIVLAISILVNIYTCLPKKKKKENTSSEKLSNYTCVNNENQLLYYISLKEHLTDYFSDMIEIMEIDGNVMMSIPYTNNQNIEIYFEKINESGDLKISDKNQTLNQLIPLHKNSYHIEDIDNFIKNKNISRNENELYFHMNSNALDFPQKLFEFMQTLTTILNLRY